MINLSDSIQFFDNFNVTLFERVLKAKKLTKNNMIIRKYRSLDAIQHAAKVSNVELFETNVSYSFRVFEDKQTTFLHIFYKI